MVAIRNEFYCGSQWDRNAKSSRAEGGIARALLLNVRVAPVGAGRTVRRLSFVRGRYRFRPTMAERRLKPSSIARTAIVAQARASDSAW